MGATSRVASAGWLVFLIVVSAVASWFGADMMFPAPVTASVTFAPQPENPIAFTADNAASWQQWHAEYILSPEFQSAVAKRCAIAISIHMATKKNYPRD